MKIINQIFRLHSRQAGFSFMEVMLVVAIVGIMTSVGLVSLNESKNRKVLEMEARKVGASIRQAQSYALTGKTGPNGIPCQFRWRNFIVSGGAGIPDDNVSYWVRAQKKADDGTCTANSAIAVGDDEKYSLQNGVTFDGISSATIDFYVPFGDVSSVKITLSKNANHYTICVNNAGVVSELAGDVNCP